MSLFGRFKDWFTNDGYNFNKEKQVYDEINNELLTIEDLLEILINGDIYFEIPEIFEGISLNPKSIINLKIIKMQQMKKASSIERQRLKNELIELENTYQIILKQMKDCLLNYQDLREVQEHILKINILINRNANYEVFRRFREYNFEYEWTLEKIELFKNLIAYRMQEIIPYLGNLNR